MGLSRKNIIGRVLYVLLWVVLIFPILTIITLGYLIFGVVMLIAYIFGLDEERVEDVHDDFFYFMLEIPDFIIKE